MEDLIKREDAIKALTEVLFDEPPYLNSIEKCETFARNAFMSMNPMTSAHTGRGEPMIKEIIYAWDSEVPKVDYVGELVRCRDCRYCTTDIIVMQTNTGYERVINLCQCPRHKEEWSVDKDWYCADGEKESE